MADLINRKNLIQLLLLAILIVAIPLAVKLVQTQQIFKSRAAFCTGANCIQFSGTGVNCPSVANCVTTNPAGTVDLNLTSPLGPPQGVP